ncbi:hypothetical protein L6164_030917 [Bauhinia variegata]|uniref:Uncharacterized protein n=1 Tax=Bauhinia variegata TaxID=167791 RepID=A0ACB9LF72_BAUVA|nr:hypothetical protein L6164_030917 [Bauhinia variegata]
MAKGRNANTYEEARKQRLEENKKRFEDLGISKISKGLTEATSPVKKTVQHLRKVKSKSNDVMELRRSSRTRNPVSYHENVGIDLPRFRKRSRSSSWGSYVARPLDELKEATDEERSRALEAAEALQSNLQSGNPSFIKSMVRSHVYSCFWLGLPTKFCEDHLPKRVCDMVLEDEDGSEYQAVFIGNRTGLSGGWRAFALEHKLDDGDALVFELIEPTRFKIYIVKALPDSTEDGKEISEEEVEMCEAKKNESQAKKTGRRKHVRDYVHEASEPEDSQEHLTESNNTKNEVKTQEENPAKKTSRQKSQKKCKPLDACEPKREEQSEEGNVQTRRMRRNSKRGKIDDSGSPQQLPLRENNIDSEVKPERTSPDKNNGFLQHTDDELKKVELVEDADKCTSKKPRKRSAPKFFRKKA